jgi:hypothetical protein
MAKPIAKTQAEQVQHLRELVGESTFQRVQRAVWKRFSPKPPPIDGAGSLAPLALFAIWDELIHELQEVAERQSATKESASGTSASEPLWELVKGGVTWTAVLTFRRAVQRWEVVITRNGQRSRSQEFGTHANADEWANTPCVEIAKGWKT